MNYKNRKNKAELIKFKDQNISKLNALITLGTESADDNDYKRSALIAYWLQDFNNYLAWEKDFSPKKLKRYERGDIIKVNLGFNVGNEQGGMHYAVVLDNKNMLNSGTLTIIPLSSKKKDKPIHQFDVDLGNDIYTKLKLKLNSMLKSLTDKLNEMTEAKSILETANQSMDSEDFKKLLKNYMLKIDTAEKELATLKKVDKEVSRMKAGSIGVVSQITTVSKMRIYDPRHDGGVLSGIKLSPSGLDLINEKIKELFVR